MCLWEKVPPLPPPFSHSPDPLRPTSPQYRRTKAEKLKHLVVEDRERRSRALVDLAKKDRDRRRGEAAQFHNPLLLLTLGGEQSSGDAGGGANMSVGSLPTTTASGRTLHARLATSASSSTLAGGSSPFLFPASTPSSASSSVRGINVLEPVVPLAERHKIRWQLASLIEPTIEAAAEAADRDLKRWASTAGLAFGLGGGGGAGGGGGSDDPSVAGSGAGSSLSGSRAGSSRPLDAVPPAAGGAVQVDYSRARTPRRGGQRDRERDRGERDRDQGRSPRKGILKRNAADVSAEAEEEAYLRTTLAAGQDSPTIQVER